MVSGSTKAAMSLNGSSARVFIECSSPLSKSCWRMLELARLGSLHWRKPRTLALLSRHGTEHLLLLAHVQRRVILCVYTSLSICSWKWIICSLVVQKGLLAPAVQGSLGSSMWWNVLVRGSQRPQGGPEDMGLWKSAATIRKTFSFFLFLLPFLASPPSYSVALEPAPEQRAHPQLHPASCPLQCWAGSGKLHSWFSEHTFSRIFSKFLERCTNFPLTHICLFRRTVHSNIVLFCPTFFP